MQLVFSAILTRAKNGFAIYIPDIDKEVRGESLFEAIKKAREALELCETLPRPATPTEAIGMAVLTGHIISDMALDSEGRLNIEHVYIDVDTNY